MKKKVLILLLFTILKVEAQTSTFFVVDSLFEKGRYKLALKKLKQIQPPSFLTNYKTAVIYESIDNYQQTAYFLEKALKLQDDEKAKIKLARAYQRLQQTHKAIKIYEEVVAKDPLNLVLKYQLGKLYLAKGNHKNSIPLFKNLIEQDVSNANYSYQLALAYAQKNDRDRMINLKKIQPT